MKRLLYVIVALFIFMLGINIVSAAGLSLTVGDGENRYELLNENHSAMGGKALVTADDGEHYDENITLYLNDYEGDYINYEGTGNLTIILKGTNIINNISKKTISGIFSRQNLAIKGPGTLEIRDYSDGIKLDQKDIEIYNTNLNIINVSNTSIMAENLTIDNSKLYVESNLYGIFIRYKIKLNKSDVEIKSGDGYDEFISGDGIENGFEFIGYDNIELYLSETPDGANPVLWDQKEDLSTIVNINYRYFKINYEPEVTGKIINNTNNNQYNILSEITLTDQDKMMLNHGIDINVYLSVEDSSNTISEEDKELINNNINDYVLDSYVDIDIYKQVGNIYEEKISILDNPIKISFLLTDKLKNTEQDIKRIYKIIRVHEGIVDILDTTFNEDKNEITFLTDRFSSYAIVYKDESIIDSPKTGDNIIKYISLGGLFTILLVSTIVVLKKSNNEK